jgi:hypothetical protein
MQSNSGAPLMRLEFFIFFNSSSSSSDLRAISRSTFRSLSSISLSHRLLWTRQPRTFHARRTSQGLLLSTTPEHSDTHARGEYHLGCSFLQAAFIGMNWNTSKWWMAQAPGSQAITRRHSPPKCKHDHSINWRTIFIGIQLEWNMDTAS